MNFLEKVNKRLKICDILLCSSFICPCSNTPFFIIVIIFVYFIYVIIDEAINSYFMRGM